MIDREEFKRVWAEAKDSDLSEYSPEMRQKIIDGSERFWKTIQKGADELGISTQEMWDRTCDYCAEQNKEHRERQLGFKPPTDWKPEWKSDDGKPFHSGESIRLKRL